MRSRIYDLFFFLLLATVLAGIGKLLSPFTGALLSALMCAITFYPIYRTLLREFPKLSPSLCAAATTILVFVFFVTPLILLTWAVSVESASLIPVLQQGNPTAVQVQVGDALETIPVLSSVRHFLASTFGVSRIQFQDTVTANIHEILGYISLSGAFIAKNVMLFVLDLFIMLFVLFFILRDGNSVYDYFVDLIPMRLSSKRMLLDRLRETVLGIVRGMLLTSLIQGVAATVGYWIVGVESAVLLGALTCMMGLVPVVGTFGIWVPVGLFFITNGYYFKGGFILFWGLVVVVGMVDTVVRPYLVGRRAHIPTIVLFFALLGGVEVWGAKGILLGPLLVTLCPVLLEMYRERYLRSDFTAAEEAALLSKTPS